MCFLFFKQKTAYEMRISDWSSDVCSSDLRVGRIGGGQGFRLLPVDAFFVEDLDRSGDDGRAFQRVHLVWKPGALGKEDVALCRFLPGHDRVRRSEEHTSELQSLMRISYAVFCLNNKTHNSYSSICSKFIV